MPVTKYRGMKLIITVKVARMVGARTSSTAARVASRGRRKAAVRSLISAGEGLTLRLTDGRIKVLSNYSSFELPRLPAGVVNEPTLNWSLSADRAGRHEFGLSYATAGLGWRAESNVNASAKGSVSLLFRSLSGANIGGQRFVFDASTVNVGTTNHNALIYVRDIIIIIIIIQML